MWNAAQRPLAIAALAACLGVGGLVGCGGAPDMPITESAGPIYEIGVSGMS